MIDQRRYTVKEVAMIFNVHRSQVYDWIHDGVISYHKFGNSYRIKEKDLIAFENRHYHKALRVNVI